MVKVRGSFWFGAAMGLLLFPLEWMGGVVFAAAVHELGHLAAMALTGGRIQEVELAAFGAVIRARTMDRGREFFCTLAGPLAGAAVMLLWRWWPAAAVAALVQTVWNLLPVEPLDGGRLVRNICCKRERFGV